MTATQHPLPLALAALAAALAMCCPRPAQAGTPIVYVDPDATGAENGTSWNDAYTRLDVALAADAGSELWLAEGVYVPPPSAEDDPRLTWFTIPAGTRVYGGFAGNELVREARDPLLHRTVLSGDLGGDDATDTDGITQDAADIVGSNAHHVVVFDAATLAMAIGADTRLDGVVITAGNANGAGVPHTWGGGAQCISGEDPLPCSPTLANVEFRGNYAVDRGGAWVSHGDTATSMPRFENVLFRRNASDGQGGAVFIDGLQGPQQVRIEDARFEHNVAGTGGAIYVNADADIAIDRAYFIGNRAQAVGGFFAEGGAIYNYGDYSGTSTVRVHNAVFQGNVATGRGGVAYTTADGGTAVLELVNITASGNSAGRGGVLYSTGDTPVVTRLRNSILWGNTATESAFAGGNNIYGHYYGFGVEAGHRVEIAHSLLEGGLASPSIVYDEDNAPPAGFIVNGAGNLASNPMFASGALLRVRDGSPAIDAGSDALNLTTLDVAGLARRVDGDGNGTVRIDMGAHEFGADGLFADGFED